MGLKSKVALAIAGVIPRGRSPLWCVLITAASAAVPAFAQNADGSCPPPGLHEAAFDIAGTVADAMRFQSFASAEYVQREQNTTFNLREATDTNGTRGMIGTEAFNDAEMRELDSLENKLPKCVVSKANIRLAFRAKRGVAAEKLGIVGIAYAYNNGTYNKNPDGSAVKGGQIVLTDLFFDRQAFNKQGTADQQLQVAMGWSTCNPAGGIPQAQLGDVAARSRSLPAQLKKLSRERIFFHEYIHGVTHEQEGDGYTDPSSVEGFFGTAGVSRYESLRAKLYQAGSPLEQFNARLRAARTREDYCAIFNERSRYLKAEGVPQRWPGDTHALDDRDEYVTILLEQMMYDKDGMTGYSAAEKQWAENWWNYTFNPAYKRNGAYPRLPFGTCPAGVPVVSNGGQGSRSPTGLGFVNGASTDYLGE